MKKSLNILLKVIATVLTICAFTGIVIFSYMVYYAYGFANDRIQYDVRATKLHLTSTIYVNDTNGESTEYDTIHGAENRIFVGFNDIPDAMKDAVVAIEDKRFFKHRGVDIQRTFGAMLGLFSRSVSYGGSTLTQQLIKNLTNDNDVSLSRKIREIFRAQNFEKDYSKDEVLEAYLNVVYFGEGCRGVQAAANTYFDKDIQDCSIAECTAIAGITQNPSKYNPLISPDNNKKRRNMIISEMYLQGKISEDKYREALIESENLNFNIRKEAEKSKGSTRNWYMDMMLNDVARDLSEKLEVNMDVAWEMIRTQGLKIYSAMDSDAQKVCDKVIEEGKALPSDKELELGFMMVGLDGRILASLGSRNPKITDLGFDNATDAVRQPGSAIKPIGVYAQAIENGICNYSTVISGAKIPNYYSDHSAGPNNAGVTPYGDLTVQQSIQWSSNISAARVLQMLTPTVSYDFMTNKLGFENLDIEDKYILGGLSLGGLRGGVTVREMAAAFQIFGNGGVYNKPYSYYYVTDRNGIVILDNRQNIGVQVISSETAAVMNKMLKSVIDAGTGRGAGIAGWNIVGKTGTTDKTMDSCFAGVCPYASAYIWTGYQEPRVIGNPSFAKSIWREIMSRYLANKPKKGYDFIPEDVDNNNSSSVDTNTTNNKPSDDALALAQNEQSTQTAEGNPSVDALKENVKTEKFNDKIKSNKTRKGKKIRKVVTNKSEDELKR